MVGSVSPGKGRSLRAVRHRLLRAVATLALGVAAGGLGGPHVLVATTEQTTDPAIADLEQRVTLLEGELSDLNDRLSQYQSGAEDKLSDHESRLKSLEGSTSTGSTSPSSSTVESEPTSTPPSPTAKSPTPTASPLR